MLHNGSLLHCRLLIGTLQPKVCSAKRVDAGGPSGLAFYLAVKINDRVLIARELFDGREDFDTSEVDLELRRNGGNGEKVPDAELYELGGLNTLRGFEYGEVGPRDSYGNTLGSRVQEVFNVELTCPIPGVPGLSTVAFFDAGNGYQKPSTVNLSNIRQTFGGGLRWVTPMGPLRLEYGRIISPRETESTGRWEFNMGAFF